MQATLPDRVRLGVFEVDLRAGELRDGARVVLLQQQPFQILSMLIARGGDVVTREEIRKKLWPNDTVVEFDHSINAAIKKLRQLLGDTADAPRYVETVARRGYRLLVPVEALPAEIKPAWVWKSESPNPPLIKLEQGTATETFHRRREDDVVRAARSSGSLIGKKVSHYRVLSVLGGGGMGMVYKAEDLKLGRQVALKFLPEEMAWDSMALKRFEREARAASSLDHPNICTIYEVEEHEEQPFIVMQMLRGETLRDRLSTLSAGGTKLGAEEFLEIASQICDGLGAAHSKGIIHRDIKPANIFVSRVVPEGSACGCEVNSVKILDFGLAKLVTTSQEAGSDGFRLEAVGTGAPRAGRSAPTDATLTRLGSAMGTAGYMSPEQVRGEKLDARSDIFSFGLVLYEMATGQRAFTGETAEAVHEAILNRTPVAVSELNAEVPRGLEQVIGKALEKDRENRYHTAAEMGCELQRIKGDLTARHSRAGRRWALWSAAAALVAVLATGLMAAKFAWQRAEAAPGLKEQQITANPLEDRVLGAAISPDGRHLAYSDITGLYLRSIDSGEIRPIWLPQELRKRISSLRWFPDGRRLIASALGSDGYGEIWMIAASGETEPKLLYRHANQPAISPDGATIAFTSDEPNKNRRELWVMRVDGQVPQKLMDAGDDGSLYSPAWSPDGRWIAYGRRWKPAQGAWSAAIEAYPSNGGSAKTLVSDASLPSPNRFAFLFNAYGWFSQLWLPDGRLLFLALNTKASFADSLLQVRLDPSSVKPTSKPALLTQADKSIPLELTATQDGKRLALVKLRTWPDVYLGDLGQEAASMNGVRRLTLDTRGSYASAWAQDSQAIYFSSGRNGRSEIFRQNLNENVAERIVAASADVGGAQLSPDGQWLLYWESESANDTAEKPGSMMMRAPVTGGSPQKLLPWPDDGSLSCASSPVSDVPCVFGRVEGKDLTFYAVDPIEGEGSRLGQIQVSGHWGFDGIHWRLSPDGSRVALVDKDKYGRQIEVLNLKDGKQHGISIEPDNETVQQIAWSADGDSLFVTAYTPDSRDLLHVEPTGKVEFLVRNLRREWLFTPLPSPDGKHLAFTAQTYDSNVWLIDNF